MWQIVVGSFILSIIHALIPNHWLPLIAIGKAERWTQREILSATLITALAHISSTIIIGIVVGFIGYKLSGAFELISSIIAPAVLVILGLIYLITDLFHAHHHEHTHLSVNKNAKSRFAILASLSIAMFLSPCIELEAYYFQAGTLGWPGILVVSAVYALVTPSLMVLLVFLGTKGLDRFNWHFLEHHMRKITGIILILLGLLAYFAH
jgi:nickel/cobalt transporter (NicO) family protein